MKRILYIVLLIFGFAVPPSSGQDSHEFSQKAVYPHAARVLDSIMAMRVPLLKVPPACRNRALPTVVDNTTQPWWPAISHQGPFYSCQQYAGVVYTFAYEINRLRQLNGVSWDNRYPAHFTWNFMNQGEQYTGVNFLQSFDVIRRQGHVCNPDFSWDTVARKLVWTNGYDRYYRGMHNRIRQVYAIEINSEAGINTMKQYLYDHLDGSPAGGVGCFSIDSYILGYLPQLPPGTPEEGSHVVTFWPANPVHGLCIAGYNDSIRFDINNDGQFTNTIDISGDGEVDARDWEIGGFKLANSYGDTWADSGYCYCLYSAMARNYEEGGVWNNRVYVVEADSGYTPLLTLKARISHNHRAGIRLLAGINADTLARIPSATMTFPIFNFQGGDHEMTGIDSVAGDNSLEMGLDVTPLLNAVPPGKAVRLFLGVEEHDPYRTGSGTIHYAAFLCYTGGLNEFVSPEGNVAIRDNQITWVSSVVSLQAPDKVQITTREIPLFNPPEPYTFQLQAEGGRSPYLWNLSEEYLKQSISGSIPEGIETPLTRRSIYSPYAALKLPFSFPFYGKVFDSLYINFYGFVSFEPQALPAPYITDECAMLNYFPVISPAFSTSYTVIAEKGDGVFMRADTACLQIRWKTSVEGHPANSNENFALIFYPDGRFEYIYGAMDDSPVLPVVYAGVVKGDQVNGTIEPSLHMPAMQDKGYRFLPPQLPHKIQLSSDGLLTVTQADTNMICNFDVRVTDGNTLSDTRPLQLSSGLEIETEVTPGSDGTLRSGTGSRLNLVVKNRSGNPLPGLQFRLMSADSSCLVTDSLASAGILQPGGSLTLHDIFAFGLTKYLPDGYTVRMRLITQSGSRVWQMVIDIPVAASEVNILQPTVADGDNHLLDPGEIADLLIQVENRGSLAEEAVEVSLLSADSAVVILSPEKQTIGRFDPYTSHQVLFRLQRSRYSLPGIASPMKAVVTSGTTVLREMDFVLSAGKKSLVIVNLGKSPRSLNAMCDALDGLDADYDTIGHLGFNYENYQALFLILGNASQGNYSLLPEEGLQLASYLVLGGNIYMESYFTWHYQNITMLHPMFRYNHATCQRYYFDHINGIEGTFTGSMSFAYDNELHSAPFSVTPVAPAYTLFANRDDPPRYLEFAFDGEDYKTIGTMLEFAAKSDTALPSTRKILMQRYLDFFEVNLSGLHPLFHVSQGKVCTGNSVNFTDDSFHDITSLQWEFPGGTPAESNLPNPVVSYLAPGQYDVKLTVSDGTNNRSLVRKDYITVSNCTDIAPGTKASQISIYPNPASDKVTISGLTGENEGILIRIVDHTGRIVRIVRNMHFTESGKASLDVAALEPGLYFVTVIRQGLGMTCKLVVDHGFTAR